MSAVPVEFERRSLPLEPCGVVGTGRVGRSLAKRVLSMDDGVLCALRGVAHEDTLLLLGASEALPWVDGVSYLGLDPGAPLLLLPTQLRPNAPLDAFERAIIRRAEGLCPPIAVLVEPPRLVPLAEARTIDRRRLQAWLDVSP
jgi:MoxR-vWA-beta-propeller ternary system domain bpX5